ncbi:MAG: DUF6868 family protein [Planctomycetota bacterium]|jgi:hypothetical protein
MALQAAAGIVIEIVSTMKNTERWRCRRQGPASLFLQKGRCIVTILEIREMLGWCSLINVVLMLVSWVIMLKVRAWAYSIHSKWFPITEQQFNVVVYSFFGLYKVLVIVFNIIPWIALSIMA